MIRLVPASDVEVARGRAREEFLQMLHARADLPRPAREDLDRWWPEPSVLAPAVEPVDEAYLAELDAAIARHPAGKRLRAVD